VLTADEVIAVVRVHADRVHDAVRRLGCGSDAAVDVVELSAHDLVKAAAADQVEDPVGWWFARARVLGRAEVGGEDDDLPVGGGVLGVDANQVRLAEALESRPEGQRAALLLRDSYDLPAASVGTTLGVDAGTAMEMVGAARLGFLPALLGGEAISLAGHQADLGAIARLAEGGQPAARDATTRRHVQSCARCADALDAMERARRLLTGLTVVALPDDVRAEMLARVESRARQALPMAEPELDEEDWDDEPRRPYSLSLIALGLLAAIGVGIGAGVVASRGSSGVSTTAQQRPQVTAPPPIFVRLPLPPTPAPPPSVSPTPRTYVITPSPTPSPTPTIPTPTVDVTQTVEPTAPTQTIDPTAGPNNTQVTVTGSGWTPNATVTLVYVRSLGQGAGDTVQVQADELGDFTGVLRARDPGSIPGPHDITIDDGTTRNTVSFNQT
jgi:DNA-directed RNA polymerase specialized sigma24 family protein